MSQSAADKLLAEIAALFRARPRGGKFRAVCPSHPDKRPSLGGSLGCGNKDHRNCSCPKDRVVMGCFAGCLTETVLEAKGLTFADLFVNNAPHRPSSPLRAARVFQPDRNQWKLDVLASKLPAIAGDVFADPDVQRLVPFAHSAGSRARSIRRLAKKLGIVPKKLGMRSGWLWTLEPAQEHEGDTATRRDAPEVGQTAEGDKSSKTEREDSGKKRPFAPSPEVQQTAEGDNLPHVRYEERRPSDVSGFLAMEKAVAEAVALFDGSAVAVRGCDGELESWQKWRSFASQGRREAPAVALSGCQGCSLCGDARAIGLYARVRPGFWLCASCWRPLRKQARRA